MRHLDGIQPPLAIYGNVMIIGGQAFYCEDGRVNVKFNPTKQHVLTYRKRLYATEKALAAKERLTAQKAATKQKYHDIKRPGARGAPGGVSAQQAARNLARAFKHEAEYAARLIKSAP